ncbi:glycosyltransferase [Saccharothrix sp. AJ9571]|nr:glycosyltransferase [Saccharothrix sp. AJ9571]
MSPAERTLHVLAPHVTDHRVTKGGTNGYRAIALACASTGPTQVHQLFPDSVTAPADSEVSRLRVCTHLNLRALVEAVEATLKPGDVVVKCVGAGRDEDHVLDVEVMDLARRAGARVAYLDGDAALRLDRMPARFYLRDLLPRLDVVFLLAGGARAEKRYLSLGAPAVVRVPPAITTFALGSIDSSTGGRTESPRATARDIDLLVTVGKVSAREARLPAWIDAAALAGRRVAVVAPPQPGIGAPIEHLAPRDPIALQKLYLRSRYTLNLLRGPALRFGHTPPNRMFEAAFAGSVVITEPYPGIEQDLVPGRECHVLTDPGALPAVLDEPVDDWQRMGAAARERVVNSARHGMAKLRSALNDLLAKPPDPQPSVRRSTCRILETLDGSPVVLDDSVSSEALEAAMSVLPNSTVRVSKPDGPAELDDVVLVLSVSAKEHFDDTWRGPSPAALFVWAPDGAPMSPRIHWLPGRDWLLTPAGISTRGPR